MQKLIQPLEVEYIFKDAHNRRVAIDGTINLAVHVGSRFEVVKFNNIELLGTDVISGCYFCEKHEEAKRQRKRLI